MPELNSQLRVDGGKSEDWKMGKGTGETDFFFGGGGLFFAMISLGVTLPQLKSDFTGLLTFIELRLVNEVGSFVRWSETKK